MSFPEDADATAAQTDDAQDMNPFQDWIEYFSQLMPASKGDLADTERSFAEAMAKHVESAPQESRDARQEREIAQLSERIARLSEVVNPPPRERSRFFGRR